MKPSVVVVGNFDGVHRGHRSVVAQARALADERGLQAVALTFDPHPNVVVGRGVKPQLVTLKRRVELLKEARADAVVVQPFTPELAAFPPERFASELLAGALAAGAVVVGEDFRFGKDRAGDLALLRALGASLGFEAHAADIAGDEAGPFSSTRVRRAVAAGDVAAAAYVLMRPHELTGVVEHGDHLGRTLGFPTANLGGVVEMLPASGVYVVRVLWGEEACGGVMNVGVRPTVAGDTLRVEVHLLDFDRDLYGQELRVHLLERLRGEQRFAGVAELRAQIAEDVAASRRVLAASGRPDG